jgi:RNA polymerase sigma factor (sigma-70 family)
LEDIAESVLLERCSRGDRSAEALLCQRYSNFIADVCFSFLVDRETSKDVAHDVLERFILKLRAGKIEQPAGWLRMEAGFRCRDALKRQKRYREIIQDANRSGLLINGGNTEDQLEAEKYLFRKTEFWNFLAKYSLREQYIFIALYYHGYGYSDLSKMIGVEVKKLYEITNNIKRNFKYFLEKGIGKKG